MPPLCHLYRTTARWTDHTPYGNQRFAQLQTAATSDRTRRLFQKEAGLGSNNTSVKRELKKVCHRLPRGKTLLAVAVIIILVVDLYPLSSCPPKHLFFFFCASCFLIVHPVIPVYVVRLRYIYASKVRLFFFTARLDYAVISASIMEVSLCTVVMASEPKRRLYSWPEWSHVLYETGSTHL